jgi:hypothetical protein
MEEGCSNVYAVSDELELIQLKLVLRDCMDHLGDCESEGRVGPAQLS